MSSRILLTGVPGVGKTTLANMIAEHYQLSPTNFGDVLFNLIQEKNIPDINSTDEIRQKLSAEIYQQLQLEVASHLNENTADNQLIISHLSVDTSYGFIPGFPETIINILRPQLTIIIEAPAAEIKERREADPNSRLRGQHLENWVDFHQQLNRSLAANYAYHTGNFILPVLNRQGKLDETFQHIQEVLDRFLK
jgi:adenylate kinase